jgi:hypothetical protein
MRWLLLLSLLLPLTARAADLPGPWVAFAADGGLDVRALVPPGVPCPPVRADGRTLPSRIRQPADAPDGAYPVAACVARAPQAATRITVEGLPVPVAPNQVNRIVVIGDTGCRLKGTFVQDCDDPVAWPFATVARLAAARHPDLVIHVGDYHYRETPCPADRPGCAGSPYGDTWAVWQRDFFTPAAPLLAAAPWVMVRGNHELCSRGGHGWTRLLETHAAVTACTDMTQPYAVTIGSLHLLVLDSAAARDAQPDPETLPLYRQQLTSLLAAAPPHSWLLTHRPIWSPTEGEDTATASALNATLQAAIAGQVPPALDMVVSGHVHDFMSLDFGPARPAQLVSGESGDSGDPIVQPPHAGLVLDGQTVRAGFGLPDHGYTLLTRSGDGWAITVYAVNDTVLARCRQHARSLVCRPARS